MHLIHRKASSSLSPHQFSFSLLSLSERSERENAEEKEEITKDGRRKEEEGRKNDKILYSLSFLFFSFASISDFKLLSRGNWNALASFQVPRDSPE